LFYRHQLLGDGVISSDLAVLLKGKEEGGDIFEEE
jgi:hypothetical protein